jgi:hypothetical protein
MVRMFKSDFMEINSVRVAMLPCKTSLENSFVKRAGYRFKAVASLADVSGTACCNFTSNSSLPLSLRHTKAVFASDDFRKDGARSKGARLGRTSPKCVVIC